MPQRGRAGAKPSQTLEVLAHGAVVRRRTGLFGICVGVGGAAGAGAAVLAVAVAAALLATARLQVALVAVQRQHRRVAAENNLALGVELRVVVRHGDDAAKVVDLDLAQTHGVSGNPHGGAGGREVGAVVVVGMAQTVVAVVLGVRVVVVGGGNVVLEVVVGQVLPGLEVAPEKVGLGEVCAVAVDEQRLVDHVLDVCGGAVVVQRVVVVEGRVGNVLLEGVAVGAARVLVGLVDPVLVVVARDEARVLPGKGLGLAVQGPHAGVGQDVGEVVEGYVHLHVEKHGGGEEDGLEHNAAPALGHGKQANQTHLAQVDAHHQVEHGARVVFSDRVGADAHDVVERVHVGHGQQAEGHEGEQGDDGRDDGVHERDDGQARVDRVGGAPRVGGERGVSVVLLSHRVVEREAHHVEQHQGDDLEEGASRHGEAVQDDVGDEEVGRLGQVCGQERQGRRGVLDNLRRHGGHGRRNRHHKEGLDNLEREVRVLRVVLDGLGGQAARELGHRPDEDRKQHHQDGQENRRQQRRDQPKQHLWEVVDEPEPLHLVSQVGQVRDETDKRHGNGPDDDDKDHERHGPGQAAQLLPPEHAHVGPEDVLGRNANVLWLEVQGLVMDDGLVGQLRVVLGLELHGYGVERLDLDVVLAFLELGDLDVQLGKPLLAVLEEIDLLADVLGEAHRGHLLLRDVAHELVGGLDRLALLVRLHLLLHRLGQELVELDLQVRHQAGPLLHLLAQLLAHLGDPDAAHAAKELVELVLVQVLVRNRLENHDSGRQLLGVERRRHEQVAQVRVEVQLPVDGEHDARVVDPRHEDVCVVAPDRAHVGDPQLVEARLALAVCGVHREEDHPQADASEAERGDDEEVPDEEVAVDPAVLDDERGLLCHECPQPEERCPRKPLRSLVCRQEVCARLRVVHPRELHPQSEEAHDEDGAHNAVGDDGRDDRLRGRRGGCRTHTV